MPILMGDAGVPISTTASFGHSGVGGNAARLDAQPELARHVDQRALRAVDDRQNARGARPAGDFLEGFQGYFRADPGRIAQRDAETHL